MLFCRFQQKIAHPERVPMFSTGTSRRALPRKLDHFSTAPAKKRTRSASFFSSRENSESIADINSNKVCGALVGTRKYVDGLRYCAVVEQNQHVNNINRNVV